MRRNINNKRRLYESIMRDVAKTVKKHLNENINTDSILTEDDIDLSFEELIEKIFSFYYPELLKQHQYFIYRDETGNQINTKTSVSYTDDNGTVCV